MIHLEELRQYENPVKYIWHPSDPLAMARASSAVSKGVSDALRDGKRRGSSFRVALRCRDDRTSNLDSGDINKTADHAICTMILETFYFASRWSVRFGARFASEKDMYIYLRLHPEDAL